MFQNFEQYLEQYAAALSGEQMSLVRSMSVVKQIPKRHFLLREGEVCRYKIFVVRGLLRTYNVDENGAEHIMRFTPENEWTTDPESFVNETPSNYNIEALEATEIVMWSREDFEILRAAIPAVNAFSERAIAQNITDTQKRVLMNISYTAEDKYRDFIASFPNVFQRVPLYMVASYLGVSRETLTRIRQGLTIAVKG